MREEGRRQGGKETGREGREEREEERREREEERRDKANLNFCLCIIYSPDPVVCTLEGLGMRLHVVMH